MPIRPFELPADTHTLIDVIPHAFKYPENEAWNVQADEVEGMIDTMQSLRRLYPLLRLIQFFSPKLRDMMRGFIWEEDGRPVGLINVMRKGISDTWLIGNVAVLPEFRRRGIARRLVEASLELATERGSQEVTLQVVAGNAPALELYERLGFTQYSSAVLFSFEQSGPLPENPMPEPYRLVPADLFDWRPRYQLALSITPQEVRQFDPVHEDRYRQPAFLRLLMPLVMRVMGMKNAGFAVQMPDGKVVAHGGYSARLRAGGVNGFNITADPAHPAAVKPLMAHLLGEIERISPGRRVELSAEQWQPATIEAAEALGMRRVLTMNDMGMAIDHRSSSE